MSGMPAEPHAVHWWTDRESGLDAVAVIDDVTLGPAAGGIRTLAYPSRAAALADAKALARAMTIKCALAGLDAGGCKIVVRDHPELDRPRAFAELGKRIQDLDGLIRTAGDMGTRAEDLHAAAEHCAFVHLGEQQLTDAVGRGLLRCVEACSLYRRGHEDIAGLRVAIQGCGAIGAAVAEALAAAGAELLVADRDAARAAEVGSRHRIADPDAILLADVDIVSPCAAGGTLDRDVARAMRAWAVVGAANNVLAEPAVASDLAARNILFVPDVIASAGAVIEGIGRTVMGLSDRTPLIDRLGATALEVLRRAAHQGRTTPAVALAMARRRLALAAKTA